MLVLTLETRDVLLSKSSLLSLSLYKRLGDERGGPTVKATIMLLVCCQLSLVLALGLPASSNQNILLPHPRNSMDDTSGEEDILAYNAAPYNRYIAKREQLQIPNMDNYNFNERFLLKRHILMIYETL